MFERSAGQPGYMRARNQGVRRLVHGHVSVDPKAQNANANRAVCRQPLTNSTCLRFWMSSFSSKANITVPLNRERLQKLVLQIRLATRGVPFGQTAPLVYLKDAHAL